MQDEVSLLKPPKRSFLHLLCFLLQKKSHAPIQCQHKFQGGLIWNESEAPAVTVRFDISILPSPFVGENPMRKSFTRWSGRSGEPKKRIKQLGRWRKIRTWPRWTKKPGMWRILLLGFVPFAFFFNLTIFFFDFKFPVKIEFLGEFHGLLFLPRSWFSWKWDPSVRISFHLGFFH